MAFNLDTETFFKNLFPEDDFRIKDFNADIETFLALPFGIVIPPGDIETPPIVMPKDLSLAICAEARGFLIIRGPPLPSK